MAEVDTPEAVRNTIGQHGYTLAQPAYSDGAESMKAAVFGEEYSTRQESDSSGAREWSSSMTESAPSCASDHRMDSGQGHVAGTASSKRWQRAARPVSGRAYIPAIDRRGLGGSER